MKNNNSLNVLGKVESNDQSNLAQENQGHSNDKKMKALYEELADKEQALILAAQFGNNLIEEKENLERQMESNRQDQLNHIESLEQESYELKRQIESMRNEYEAKIYELTDDLHMMNKKLIRNDQNKNSQQQDQNEQFILIQELTAKNQKLDEEIKANELKYAAEKENKEALELRLQDKDLLINENTKIINSFQKEITNLINKQQDLEYALMQTCNERDKQAKLIEELTKKYLFVENEKNEIEHLVFQHENEIFNLRRVNQDLIYKFEKMELHSNVLNRKRRSCTENNNSNFESPNTNPSQLNSIKSHLNGFKRNENKLFDNQFDDHHRSSPFRQIDNSNFFHNSPELESDNEIDAFKMNEIEEDDLEDADESVDMYTKSAYLENESTDHFLGAINWQQEAIEQTVDDENENDNSRGSHDLLNNDDRNQNDHSNYILNQNRDDSQGPYRSMEDDSNNSLLN